MLCECGVTYCYILVPFWCVWSSWQCFCFILLLFQAPPHFPAQFREWGKQKVILFLSMSIITQYTRRGQMYYPARKNMLGGGRGETGVLSMFLFSNQIINCTLIKLRCCWKLRFLKFFASIFSCWRERASKMTCAQVRVEIKFCNRH